MSHGEERLYFDEARNKALRRQADALQGLVEETRKQNALLMQQVLALEKLASIQFKGTPEDKPRPATVAGNVESCAIDLEQHVDLESVDLWGGGE